MSLFCFGYREPALAVAPWPNSAGMDTVRWVCAVVLASPGVQCVQCGCCALGASTLLQFCSTTTHCAHKKNLPIHRYMQYTATSTSLQRKKGDGRELREPESVHIAQKKGGGGIFGTNLKRYIPCKSALEPSLPSQQPQEHRLRSSLAMLLGPLQTIFPSLLPADSPVHSASQTSVQIPRASHAPQSHAQDPEHYGTQTRCAVVTSAAPWIRSNPGAPLSLLGTQLRKRIDEKCPNGQKLVNVPSGSC